jgi:site-specific recombinase XerD
MISRANYLLLESFLRYLADVSQVSRDTFERYTSYLKPLLYWAGETAFSEVVALRPTFPQFLLEKEGRHSNEGLSRSTLRKSCQLARRFFHWAKLEFPREFKAISASWIASLRPPRLPEAQREHVFVTLEEVRHLTQLPAQADDLAQLRDRAMTAFLFLSGMRAGAFGSLPISAVDLAERQIKQWPSLGVHTKNGLSRTTYLLHIPELLEVVTQWDTRIRSQLPETAMWYTPITMCWGQQILSPEPAGAHRNGAVSGRLQGLYQQAGLPYKSAHKFRHGHAVFALQHARTMADYKAISQNLMHSDVRITDGIYAPLLGDEVRERITALTSQAATSLPGDNDLASVLRGLSRGDQAKALHTLRVADEIARS